MFSSKDEQVTYIRENYLEVTDQRIDESHWDLHCDKCGVVRGFQVTHLDTNGTRTDYSRSFSTDFNAARTVYFRCPVCKTYKQWVLYTLSAYEGEGDDRKWITRHYRIASVPAEGMEDIAALPERPAALRIAYRQAIRAMNGNAHIAAAAMFRRAVQVITRDILKCKPGNLAAELKALTGTKFNGVTLTKDFADNGYILKEAGNQAAHPDGDPDLLEFAPEDAQSLQEIFMELVSDIFIVPEATRKAKEDFMGRRKIILPQK